MSSYQEEAKVHESVTLRHLSNKKNQEQELDIEHKLFVNLSLREIMSNMSATIIVIINELLDPRIKKSPSNLITIFFQDDRMIYLGLFVALSGLGIYLIDITK